MTIHTFCAVCTGITFHATFTEGAVETMQTATGVCQRGQICRGYGVLTPCTRCPARRRRSARISRSLVAISLARKTLQWKLRYNLPLQFCVPQFVQSWVGLAAEGPDAASRPRSTSSFCDSVCWDLETLSTASFRLDLLKIGAAWPAEAPLSSSVFVKSMNAGGADIFWCGVLQGKRRNCVYKKRL